MSKEDKQRDFLAPRVSQAKYAAVYGVNSLRATCCVVEADECEKRLNEALEILENVPVTKDNLKKALDQIETTINVMMYVFVDKVFGKDSGNSAYDIDEKYLESPNSATIDYQRRIEKSLEAKQNHAPGFDGQGGGRARN